MVSRIFRLIDGQLTVNDGRSTGTAASGTPASASAKSSARALPASSAVAQMAAVENRIADECVQRGGKGMDEGEKCLKEQVSMRESMDSRGSRSGQARPNLEETSKCQGVLFCLPGLMFLQEMSHCAPGWRSKTTF
jgi:hypothetical protein